MKYLVVRLRDLPKLRDELQHTARARELEEVQRMLAMSEHYNWRGDVPLQWKLEGDDLLGRDLLECVKFFEIPYEERVYKTP